LPTVEAKKKITSILEKKTIGQAKVNYRLRDWGVSRQRYWGTPIPIIYCDKDGTVPVPEKDLPIRLPENVEFKGTGGSPLAQDPNFVKVKCPMCGDPADGKPTPCRRSLNPAGTTPVTAVSPMVTVRCEIRL